MVSTMGAAALTALVLSGWGVDGNGRIKEEARQVAAFTGVEVSGGLHADVKLGKEQKVTLETDENLLPLVTTEVKDGVLHVYSKKSLDPTREVRVTVVATTLNHLGASGGVELNAEVGKSEDFTLEGSGGAKFRVKGLDARKLKLDLSGGVDAKLEGKAEDLDLDLSGGVDLDATHLEARTANLDASGGVDAELNVKDSLKGDASGGVDVKVKGRPAINVDTSAAASVKTE